MISYSTNWMGPINMQWYEERGLTCKKSYVLDENTFLVDVGIHKVGDVVEYDEITTYYSAGRIDIYNVPGEHYPLEYGLAPMHGEDWNDFSYWLESFQTHELWEFNDIITQYESATGKKIRWAAEYWYTCLECWMITDLRETTEYRHKMDCGRGRV